MPEIAILDDDRNLVVALTLQLQAVGYTVRAYSAPHTALPELIANPPDLLLLNGRMPGLHGIEVFRQFREHSQSPVIFVSASAEEIEATLETAGTPAEGYVPKPVWFDELAPLIERLAHASR